MHGDAGLARLLAEAEARPLEGWDLGRLGDRMKSTPLPWSFEEIVVRHARASPDLLDLGTGGGEWLAALPFRPPRTVATESWEPNVAVARARLAPLALGVVQVEPAPDNVDQDAPERRGGLPFPSECFTHVVSRHESFVAREVARVLVPGGRFLTQQVGSGRYDELHDALGLRRRPAGRNAWTLALARTQVEAAGLVVAESGEAETVTSFADVGALAWYLEAAPWVAPGFSVREHGHALAALHEKIATSGPYEIREPSFRLEAVRAPASEGVG